MSYDQAVTTLKRWCSNVVILPRTPPFGADGSQLFVNSQVYTPPSAPTTPVSKPPAALFAQVSSPSPGQPTPVTPAPPPSPGQPTCDTSVAHTVTLTLFTSVPNVVGLSVGPAGDRLRQRGLVLESGCGEAGLAGVVLHQDPARDTRIDVGDKPKPVSVTTSGCTTPTPTVTPTSRVGPTVTPTFSPGQRTSVPNVVGMDEYQACSSLSAHRLQCHIDPTGSGPQPGTVKAQSPAPNSVVPANSPVELSVARPNRVPDVRNSTAGQACATINSAHLTCVTPAPQGGGTPGQVLAQDPAPGTLVDDGTPVTLQLAAEQQPAPGVPPWLIPVALALLVAAGAAVQRYRTRHRPPPPQVEVRLRPGAPHVRGDEAREW
jgi:beta-lactam-binding protein with PASTA domain